MKKAASDTTTIVRSASAVSAAVMCSRVLGLVREQAFAYLFGAGPAFDAFVVAFRIPNLLRDLFGEGALSTAFVTVFSDCQENRDAEHTWRLAGNVIVFFSLLVGLICLVGIWQSDNLVRLLVEKKFEIDPGRMGLAVSLTRIMFPFLLFVSLASVVMGILNSRGYFFIPALASSFFNFGSISVGVALALIFPAYGLPAIAGMAFGTLVGGFLQLAGQIPSLYRSGFRFIPNLNLGDPGLKRVLRLMLPAVVGLSALQLNVFINNFFASSLVVGSLSWLNYAFRIFQFPVGVFGVALAIAATPVMARHAARKDIAALRETYTSSLLMSLALSIPATVGLLVLSEPVVRVIFQYGRFDAVSARMTAAALDCFVVGLFAYAAVKVTVPVFYALDETRYPVVGSFIAVAINLLVVLTTIGTLAHRAMALGISLGMVGNFLFLLVVVYHRLGGFSRCYLFAGLVKILTAATGMGLVAAVGLRLITLWEGSRVVEISVLSGVIVAATVTYGMFLHLLGLKEFDIVVTRVRARLAGG